MFMFLSIGNVRLNHIAICFGVIIILPTALFKAQKNIIVLTIIRLFSRELERFIVGAGVFIKDFAETLKYLSLHKMVLENSLPFVSRI